MKIQYQVVEYDTNYSRKHAGNKVVQMATYEVCDTEEEAIEAIEKLLKDFSGYRKYAIIKTYTSESVVNGWG